MRLFHFSDDPAITVFEPRPMPRAASSFALSSLMPLKALRDSTQHVSAIRLRNAQP